MATTYYETTSAADNDSSGLSTNKALAFVMPSAGTVTLNAAASGTAASIWFSPATDPTAATASAWPTGVGGTYVGQYDVASIGANLTFVSATQLFTRFNSTLTTLVGNTSASLSSTSGTGIKTATSNAAWLPSGTEASSDRFGLRVVVSNGSSMTAQSAVLNVGTTNSKVTTTAWTSGATTPATPRNIRASNPALARSYQW